MRALTSKSWMMNDHTDIWSWCIKSAWAVMLAECTGSYKFTTQNHCYMPLEMYSEMMNRLLVLFELFISIDWSTLFIDWLIDWFSPLQTAWATLISFFFMENLLKDSFCDFRQILLCKFLLQCQNIDGIFRDVLCI